MVAQTAGMGVSCKARAACCLAAAGPPAECNCRICSRLRSQQSKTTCAQCQKAQIDLTVSITVSADVSQASRMYPSPSPRLCGVTLMFFGLSHDFYWRPPLLPLAVATPTHGHRSMNRCQYRAVGQCSATYGI